MGPALGNAAPHFDWWQYLSDELQSQLSAEEIGKFKAQKSPADFPQRLPLEAFLQNTDNAISNHYSNHLVSPQHLASAAAPLHLSSRGTGLPPPLASRSHEVPPPDTIDPAELTRNSNDSTTLDDKFQWPIPDPAEPAGASSSFSENEGDDAAVTAGTPDTPPTSDSMEDGMFHCDECDYSSPNVNHLTYEAIFLLIRKTSKINVIHRQHRFVHGEGTICDTCQKRLCRPSSLLRHKRIIHPDPK